MFRMFSSKIRYYPRLPLSRDIKAFKWLLVTWYNWKISRISMAVRISNLTKTNRLSIICQKNRALDECRGELEAFTTTGKTGQSDVPSNETSEKPRAERDNRKKRGFNLAIDIRYGIVQRALFFWSSIACHSREKSKNATEMRGQGVDDYRKGWW